MTQTLPLFEDLGIGTPITEGVKYAGSKLKLIPQVLQLASKVDAHTVLDGFSGTTRVSQAFAQAGYDVVCNDASVWSEIFGTCYLLNQKTPQSYHELIDHLNAVKPINGWFTEQYGGFAHGRSSIQKDGLKKPWQVHNTRKLDGIREEIDRLKLSKIERAVAITSLIMALDRVDNTLGHFVSYLREWSARSFNDLTLKVPNNVVTSGQHAIYRKDIFELVPQAKVDLAYFDPPYGSNNEKMPPSRVRYASYYHLWTTVCLNDKPPVFGKARRRVDSSDTISGSVFEEFRRNNDGKYIALDAIERLIEATQAKWIILSYSSGGRATATELNELLRCHGTVLEVMNMNYKKNVMSDMKWTNDWLRDAKEPHQEFLFLIEKTQAQQIAAADRHPATRSVGG